MSCPRAPHSDLTRARSGTFWAILTIKCIFFNLKQSAAPSVNMTEPTSCRFRLGQQMNPWPHSTNVANVVIAGGNNTGYNFQKKNYFPSLIKSIRKNHSTPRGDCSVLSEKKKNLARKWANIKLIVFCWQPQLLFVACLLLSSHPQKEYLVEASSGVTDKWFLLMSSIHF